MRIPGLNDNNPVIKRFVKNQDQGIFLFDLFPFSDITIFHQIKIKEGKSNGIIILGNEGQLEFLSRTINDKLLNQKHHDGFWSALLENDDNLILVYNFKKDLSVDDIIELLGLKFRNDLNNICELLLSSISFLLVKIQGQIHKSFPLRLENEQTDAIPLPIVNIPGTIIRYN